MTEVVLTLEVALIERRAAPQAYEGLRTDLERLGYSVEEQPPTEYRSGGGGADLGALVSVVIWLSAAVGAKAIDAIVDAALQRIREAMARRKLGTTRRVVIFGPDGEALREVDVPEES